MSRRKQTKPSHAAEDHETDVETLRFPQEIEGDEISLHEDESQTGTIVKKKSIVESHKISLLGIKKKQSSAKRHRDFSDMEEESVVSYKVYQDLQDSCVILKKRLRDKDLVIAEKDATVRKLSEKYRRTSLELEKIRELNICLQEQLLLKNAGSHRKWTISTGTREASGADSIQRVCELEVLDEVSPEALVKKELGEVDLGYGVLLDKQKWKVIQRMDSHSKFCKSLAVAIWGADTLRERSVTGSKSNAVKGSVAKPPLSPEKVGVIRECLKERLEQRGYQREAIDGQLRLVRRFLSEKICDIKRKVSGNSEVRGVPSDAAFREVCCYPALQLQDTRSTASQH